VSTSPLVKLQPDHPGTIVVGTGSNRLFRGQVRPEAIVIVLAASGSGRLPRCAPSPWQSWSFWPSWSSLTARSSPPTRWRRGVRGQQSQFGQTRVCWRRLVDRDYVLTVAVSITAGSPP